MRDKIQNHLLLLEIAIADQRTEELIEKARELFVMHNADCCMLSNLSFWMDINDEKMLEFEQAVLDAMPVIEEDYFEGWNAMDVFEKAEFIFVSDEPQELACSYTTYKFS